MVRSIAIKALAATSLIVSVSYAGHLFVMADDEPTALQTARAVPVDAAVERARREVRMLDDLYKSSIVLITTHYVDDENALPAGSAFQALFEAMKEKGWHEVRLLDGTGKPLNSDNKPKAGFEAEAMAQIVRGEAVTDSVVTENGQRFLLTATPIPVVMDKCVMCHDNFKDLPAGQAIGALGYKVPVIGN